ncbi:MAG: putative nucleic acid-binding protein, contains PIN domain protein [uncultured archaeon A07HN63]|nr:MAG: putative nucleic acid-binding protein, contains PIN domain protein [uncultured archaeon A07HN63]
MAVALVDTNVLFASASARDAYHDRASEIIRGIDHGELPDAIVTNYVVAETLNIATTKLGSDAASQLLDRLIAGARFELTHVAQADFTAAQPLFRRYSELSFVDAILVAHMHRTDIEYIYSFDDDFDAVSDITRLATATNPFS